MKAAVYLRQSDDRHLDHLAIDRQREDCHKLCEARGWDPVDYVDNDTSAVGAKRKRPAWDQMLLDIEAGIVQAVVCWDLDRLYREPIDLELIIPLADRMQVALATVSGGVDLSTDNGRMFARVKGAYAKSETDRRSARQKRKFKQMAEAGDSWSSKRPFGYTRDGELVPEEAAALREAYKVILAGQTNLTSIGRDWDARGITTTGGSKWSHPTTLRTVLLSPRNAGLRSYLGEIVGQGKWEPIVERDVWQAVCDILNAPERRAGHGGGRKYLLTGIALCGRCLDGGDEVTVGSARNGPKSVPHYRCRTCFKIMRLQDRTDDFVTRMTVARLGKPDALELLVDRQRPDLEALRTEASTLRERLETLALDYAEGLLTREQLRVATERVRTKLSRVESSMTDAGRARLFQGLVGEGAVGFAECTLDRRRAVVDALMRVVILPATRRGLWSSDDIQLDWRGE